LPCGHARKGAKNTQIPILIFQTHSSGCSPAHAPPMIKWKRVLCCTCYRPTRNDLDKALDKRNNRGVFFDSN
jgi:hypothetical protein